MTSQPSTTYAVINTGSGSPQVIFGFGAADGLTLIGFLGPELTFAPTAADATAQGGVHQHLIADGDVHVVQQLCVVLDRVAAGKEHHHLQFNRFGHFSRG